MQLIVWQRGLYEDPNADSSSRSIFWSSHLFYSSQKLRKLHSRRKTKGNTKLRMRASHSANLHRYLGTMFSRPNVHEAQRITIQSRSSHKAESLNVQGNNIYETWSAKVQGLIFTRQETSKSIISKARHRHIHRHASTTLTASTWQVQLPQHSDNYMTITMTQELASGVALIYGHADELIAGRCVVPTGNSHLLMSRFGTAFPSTRQDRSL